MGIEFGFPTITPVASKASEVEAVVAPSVACASQPAEVFVKVKPIVREVPTASYTVMSRSITVGITASEGRLPTTEADVVLTAG